MGSWTKPTLRHFLVENAGSIAVVRSLTERPSHTQIRGFGGLTSTFSAIQLPSWGRSDACQGNLDVKALRCRP